jgi:hypothetical protein
MAGEKSMTGVIACRQYEMNNSELGPKGYKTGTMDIKPVERFM